MKYIKYVNSIKNSALKFTAKKIKINAFFPSHANTKKIVLHRIGMETSKGKNICIIKDTVFK